MTKPELKLTCGKTDVDLRQVVDIAKAADKAILSIYHSDKATWDVEFKDDNKGPLTRADRDASDIICSSLRKLYPSIPIICEEEKVASWEARRKYDYFWCVDPLDGTKEFIKRSGQFTVNIALCHAGKPIAGVVTVPVDGTVYYAVEGLGAYKEMGSDGSPTVQRIKVATFNTESEGVIIVGSSSHRSEEAQEFAKTFRNPVFKLMGCVSLQMFDGVTVFIYSARQLNCYWWLREPHMCTLGLVTRVSEFASVGS
eukprot:GHVN01073312.1.p1 GENE.GHVN01073312.1~~GHVN01073312.1.p1  ORF type:complete len:255 (+),score=33.44 GHVN01073312.1:57-821(+)